VRLNANNIELNLISNITGIDQPSIEIIKKKYCSPNAMR